MKISSYRRHTPLPLLPTLHSTHNKTCPCQHVLYFVDMMIDFVISSSRHVALVLWCRWLQLRVDVAYLQSVFWLCSLKLLGDVARVKLMKPLSVLSLV